MSNHRAHHENAPALTFTPLADVDLVAVAPGARDADDRPIAVRVVDAATAHELAALIAAGAGTTTRADTHRGTRHPGHGTNARVRRSLNKLVTHAEALVRHRRA